jgi:hypothetical protein
VKNILIPYATVVVETNFDAGVGSGVGVDL